MTPKEIKRAAEAYSPYDDEDSEEYSVYCAFIDGAKWVLECLSNHPSAVILEEINEWKKSKNK